MSSMLLAALFLLYLSDVGVAFRLAGGSTTTVTVPRCPKTPKTCEYLDCPKYTVLANYDDAQLRTYEPATWVTTEVHRRRYDWAVPIGFHRLLQYIRGNNEDSVKLEMTAPVLVEATLGVVGLKRHVNESFFIPYKYQMDPPTPSCENLDITCTGNRTVFVLPFGGYATGALVEVLARDFIRNLEESSLIRNAGDNFFVAIYDPPFKVIGRYNEIWVPATNSTQWWMGNNASEVWADDAPA